MASGCGYIRLCLSCGDKYTVFPQRQQQLFNGQAFANKRNKKEKKNRNPYPKVTRKKRLFNQN